LATKCLQMDLRGDLHLGMHQGVRNPRRNQVTPKNSSIGVLAREDKQLVQF